MAREIQIANEEYAIKVRFLAQEIAALDKGGKDYQNKLRERQNKEKQLTQSHENEITAIKTKAEEERNTRVLSAFNRFNDAMAGGLTSSIMRHQSFAKMVTSLGDQVVSGMMQNAIQSMLTEDMTKEKDAAAAARKAFNIGISIGGPAGIILGPVMGAAAFASVMAFEHGGIVPGIGSGDTVPAMLTPGEPVLPKNMADRLNRAMDDTGHGGDKHYHAHVHPTYNVNTIDGDGMQDALDKHTDVLTKHVENTLRKLNR